MWHHNWKLWSWRDFVVQKLNFWSKKYLHIHKFLNEGEEVDVIKQIFNEEIERFFVGKPSDTNYYSKQIIIQNMSGEVGVKIKTSIANLDTNLA